MVGKSDEKERGQIAVGGEGPLLCVYGCTRYEVIGGHELALETWIGI